MLILTLLIILAAPVIALMLMHFHRKRIKLIERGFCAACGYDLRGLSQTRCPECASPFDPAEITARADPL